MINLIGISGRMGSGKDLLADMIQYVTLKNKTLKHYRDIGGDIFVDYLLSFEEWNSKSGILPVYENKKFAGILKDITCMIIGCTREQLEDRDFKEKPLGDDWWCYNVSGTLLPRWYYKDALDNKICEDRYLMKMTPRFLLQLLGTEAGRQIIHPNIWVNALFSTYSKKSKWIITDVRFPNEADAIKEKGGTLIRLDRWNSLKSRRPGWSNMPSIEHSSESALDNYKNFDLVIKNDGSINDLLKKVEAWIQ